MATLKDFLETGRLGPIEIGSSMHFVKEILGEPDDRSLKTNPQIWKYGGIQLGFYRPRHEQEFTLATLHMTFANSMSSIPEALSMTDWLPTNRTTIGEFVRYLTEIDLPIIDQPPFQDLGEGVTGQTILLQSSVKLVFEDQKLSSIQYMANNGAETKQFSLSIGKNDFEVIRKEADSHHLSVSAFCAKLITEHAQKSIKAISQDRLISS